MSTFPRGKLVFGQQQHVAARYVVFIGTAKLARCSRSSTESVGFPLMSER